MLKQCEIPPGLMGEDNYPADPISTNTLKHLSEVQFRVEIFRLFKEFKETMDCTNNNTLEDMREEMRKLQIEELELKYW